MPVKNTLLNSITLLISIILLGVFAEIVIRLNPKLFCEGYRPSQNERIVYELCPGHEMKSLKAKISSQGLNDRYFPLKKQPGVFRIGVVGDSQSFGFSVRPQDSFPKVLERMLNNGNNRKFEVINFSVPGYNTSQEYELIKEKVMQFEPDMIILNFCGNDTHMCNFFKPKVTFANYLYNKSYFIRLLLRRLDAMFMRNGRFLEAWFSFKKNILGVFYCSQMIYPYPGLEETIYVDHNPSDRPENTPERYRYMLGYDNYKIHVRSINDLLQRHAIILVSSGNFTQEALAINREAGIENICDFNEIFKADPASPFLIDEGHYNEEGNRLLAEHLYNFLHKNNLLK